MIIIQNYPFYKFGIDFCEQLYITSGSKNLFQVNNRNTKILAPHQWHLSVPMEIYSIG